ncbi:MAG TPA: hypothetical protein VGQ58_12380 [Candidatus Limnocylindrales bacterium]|jgi:hypothetical protein|nr:hypothetical protein [Candidatus Limnocylindrales bacterium]
MKDLDGSGFTQLDRLLDLVARTRELLDAVAGHGELPEGGAAYLEGTTLPHLEDVHAGFQGSLRSDAAGADELRYVLLQVAQLRVPQPRTEADRRAAAAEILAERAFAGLSAGDPESPVRLASSEPWQLAAVAHARVVLAFIPRVPEDAVRFPGGRRTYADIPAPRGPAELAARIEELERQLWMAVTGRAAAPVDPAFRRTYGFFDAADRLGFRAFRGAA